MAFAVLPRAAEVDPLDRFNSMERNRLAAMAPGSLLMSANDGSVDVAKASAAGARSAPRIQRGASRADPADPIASDLPQRDPPEHESPTRGLTRLHFLARI